MNFEWISVNERLPSEEEIKKHEGYFICYCVIGDGEGKITEYSVILNFDPMPGQKYKWTPTDSEIVTHWANFPESPKEIILKNRKKL